MNGTWLDALEDAQAGGAVGVVLTFNTSDHVRSSLDGRYLRLREAVCTRLAAAGYAVVLHSLAEGARQVQPPLPADRAAPAELDRMPTGEPEEVLVRLGRHLTEAVPKVALVIDHADHLAPDPGGLTSVAAPSQLTAVETLHNWGTDPAVKATDNLVVLICHENQLHSLLRDGGAGYRVVRVELPDESEREQFISHLDELRRQGNDDFGKIAPDLDTKQLAASSGGLRLTDLEGLFRRAAATGRPVDRDSVVRRKAQVISELGGDRIEVREPTHGFDAVAGLDHVVDYFRECVAVDAIPQGVLLAGVPGTGKSFVVLALSYELGYPCLMMRNVRDRWVGASERNLDQVLWVAEALAPCVVWIDEVDQVVGQRSTSGSTDGGTSERMMARLWEFLGETGAQRGILWIATTNRPDLMDPAMLDRFPVVIPFVHPTPADVEQLLPVLATQQGRQLAEGVDLAAALDAPSLQLPTVRALLEVVSTAARWTDLDSAETGRPIGGEQLVAAAHDFKPNYDRDLHTLIALEAIRMTSFQSLLPWRSRHGVRTGVHVPGYLADLIDQDGLVRTDVLQDRISELQQVLRLRSFARQV